MSDPDPKAAASAIKARFTELANDTKVPNLVTKAEWKALKSDAGVKSAKGLFKSHASVGKYLDKFHSAKTAWDSSKGLRSLEAYFTATQKLEKALKDFLKSKDLEKNDKAKDLKKQVTAWQDPLAKLSKKLAETHKSDKKLLAAKDAKDMKGMIDEMGIM